MGAIVGAGIGSVISDISNDVLSRYLSKKEKDRIIRVKDITTKMIEENIKAGKILRDDDFFSNNNNDRSTAEEILKVFC